MKRLTDQVLYHPLVALSTLYLAEMLSRSDIGLSGTLFIIATRSIVRLVGMMRGNTA